MTLSKVTALLALILPFPLMAQDAQGTWATEKTDQGHLEIRISPCGAALCGTVIRAVDLKGRPGEHPAVGRKMVWDMMPNGAGKWSGGQIWDPRRDKTFKSKMEVTGQGLKVSGCVLAICQSQVWRAVK